MTSIRKLPQQTSMQQENKDPATHPPIFYPNHKTVQYSVLLKSQNNKIYHFHFLGQIGLSSQL